MRPAIGLALLCVVQGCAPAGRERAPADSTSGTAAGRASTDSVASALLVQADSQYRPNPDSANVLFVLARDAAVQARDSVSLSRALTGMGQVARVQGRFEDARLLGERALTIKLRLSMNADLFRSYNALGLLARDEERLADASELFQLATAAARKAGNANGVAMASINTGLVLDNRGEFDSARVALRTGVDGARAAGDTANLGRGLTNLASLDIRLGDPLSGIASLELARQLATAAGDKQNEANALAQLATAYDAIGEPQRAFASLDSALVLAREYGYRVEEADDLRIQADLYAAAGDWRRALDGYARAATIDHSLDRPEERGDDLRREARALFALGQSGVAVARAADALQVHREGAFRASELDDLSLLAELSQADGRVAEAEGHLREAKRLATSLKSAAAIATVALAEARVADWTGDPSRVLAALNSSRASLSVAPASGIAEAMALEARAYATLGRFEAAVATGRQAVAAVERVRSNYGSGVLRTSYAADRVSVYAELVLALLRLNRPDEALQVADAARGRALLDHLISARVNLDSATPAARTSIEAERLLRRIDDLVSKLDALQRRPPRERTSRILANSQEIADRLGRMRSEYEALVARTTQGSTTPSAFLAPHAGDTRALRSMLSRGEVLVEYLVTPDRLLIFVVTRDRIEHAWSNVTATELLARVRLARALLGVRDAGSEARPVLEGLHDILFPPMAMATALRGARRLLIVPHATLTYLPFGALIDPRSNRYLMEDFSILSLPSAAALVALRAHGDSRAVAGAGRATIVALAPFPLELPGSQREVGSVARAMAGSSVLLGASATEARARQALATPAIVHAATHAVMNARNPLFSRLEMRRDGGTTSGDDGRLEVREVLEMRVRSPLVFLSGCDTGLGASWSTPFETGEDYSTLAQAFLFAGTRTVVSTLWRIDDAAAAELAERFYEGLRFAPAPEALVQAQRALLREMKYRDPYYWAAYQVSGGEGLDSTFAQSARMSVERLWGGLNLPGASRSPGGTSK